MLNLPGSLPWFFLLVYFACGQILDNASLDTSNKELDELDRAINNTSIQRNDEEKENKPPETVEEENPNIHPSDPSLNKTTTPKPRNGFNKSQELVAPDISRNRNQRRRPTYHTSALPIASEIPLMSQERRNSYLSIAERRKYYNRTRVQSKKTEANDVELEHPETTSKLLTSTTETLQLNEIHVIKKPIIKDSSRAVTDEKIESNNQRAFGGSSGNDTQTKPQNTRKSVIQSQYQFGQKLNLRKPVVRGQDNQDERSKKERSKVDSIIENSTNKLNKNYPTQSTRLIRVDKNLWATTTVPKPDEDDENLVLQSQGNVTAVGKLGDNVTAYATQPEVLPNTATSSSVFDNRLAENISRVNPFKPLPLSYEKNVTAEEEKGAIRDVYNQEILRLSNLTEAVESPVEILKNFDPNSNRSSASYIQNTSSTFLDDFKSSTEKPLEFLNISTTEKSSAVPKDLAKGTPTTAPTHVRNGKFSHYAPTRFPQRNATASTDGPQSTTPFVRVIPKAIAVSPDAKPIHNETTKKQVPAGDPERKTPHPHPVESWSSTEEYPLTIELNENNKRVLSEMFQTSTTPQPKKPERFPGSSRNSTKAIEVTAVKLKTTTTTTTTTTSTTTTTTTTTTTESPQVLLPEDPQEEDHKAQGTQHNTKFYISPNVNRTQVIKVVEDEDAVEDDTEGVLRSRSAGVAIYVLSAFGLVPLLLALIFATKFIIQRQQRQYECESDAKSDISAMESQSRENRKKKGSTDLKKSPSNVTTTTLVTTTRLPRVQHWENCDKQGSRNWEFPRSKLKLMTILGQGNFGQVWKAEAEDMAGHEGVTRLVAVKTVKEGATEKEHEEFIKELEIMQQIGSHPNIVTLLGCCTDQEPYYLIMEYVKYGKLLTFLREHRVNENYYNFSNNADALTSRDLTVFAYCVSRGMEYLASRGIIHRDLAARNVLVDHTKLCKIADFGMSRSVRDFDDGQVYEERQHKGALPIRWMAPESLVYSVFTYKSDVWSFGILMWEIVTLGSTPYPNMGAREVMRKVRDGYRLERPSHCKPEFFRLISHCWAHDPNKRPDFSELRHELGNLLDNPTKDGSYVDLDRFAINNSFHVSSKTNDLRLLERNEFKTLKRLGDWDSEDWPEDTRKSNKAKKGRNNGKGTVTLTGQGSFTVNSRILEKEFKMI